LPQCICLLGPKSSGKTSIGAEIAKRTNAKLIDFIDFLNNEGLAGQDDETIIKIFINYLSKQTKPRVILENFPQNIL
jgi:shikimate kinase